MLPHDGSLNSSFFLGLNPSVTGHSVFMFHIRHIRLAVCYEPFKEKATVPGAITGVGKT
jgi:hypothetical protein